MDNEKKIMSITLPDGSIDEVEVLLVFEFKDNNKEYMVYTKNETDDKGNVTIYVASVQRGENDKLSLSGVDSDEEWTRIKDVLRELSKDEEEQ